MQQLGYSHKEGHGKLRATVHQAEETLNEQQELLSSRLLDEKQNAMTLLI